MTYQVICDKTLTANRCYWNLSYLDKAREVQHLKDIQKSYLCQVMLKKFYTDYYDLHLPYNYNIPNCPIILNLYELFEPTVPFDDLTNIVDRHYAVRKPIAHHWVFHTGSTDKSGLQTHRIWFKSLEDMIVYRTAM